MRLKELHVRDRGVLRRLDLAFDEQFLDKRYGLDFIVGVNGTGKSTVLRTIAGLVDASQRGAELTFPFKMVLLPEVGAERTVTLTNMDEYDNRLRLPAGAPAASTTELPQVILFAAGAIPAERYDNVDLLVEEAAGVSAAERLQSESPGHLPPGDAADQAPNKAQAGVGQVLVIGSEHLPLVMLCGWLTDQRGRGGAGLKAAFKGASVERICGFSLRVLLGDGFDEKDETLASLVAASSRQIRTGSEYLLVFDVSRNPHLYEAVLSSPDRGLILYRWLLALFEQRQGEQRRLRVDIMLERTPPTTDDEAPPIDDSPPLHLFDWLSDGEQSFLGRMALFPLLGKTEAIVMLDEPENHFNDVWKREIIRFLDGSMHENRSHILISTHASITLTDVPLNHIHILQHDGCYTVGADHPSVQTFGVDASEIMTEVFGADQSTGRFSAEHIRSELENIARDNSQTARRMTALRNLLNQVGPGYWSYVIRQELQRLADKK